MDVIRKSFEACRSGSIKEWYAASAAKTQMGRSGARTKRGSYGAIFTIFSTFNITTFNFSQVKLYA